MADTVTVKAQVDATIEERVSAYIQMVLNANLVVAPTLLDLSSQAGPGIDVVQIPRFGKFTVSTVTPGTAVDAQANAFSADAMNLDQYKAVQFLVQDLASTQAKVNVSQAYLEQAGKDLATELDQSLADALEAGVSTAAPDHKRAYAGSTIAKADILTARQLLNEQNVPLEGRSAYISPAQEASILAISEFVRVDESGGSEALRNGRIGKLFGFDIYVTSLAEDAKSMFYHQSALAWARQLMPKTEFFRDVPMLADRYSISHIYGRKILDSGKRVVLMGTA